MGMESVLSGMTAIREYCRSINLASAEVSVIQMIKECGFPARKIGGIWESDKDLIVAWRKKYIAGETDQVDNSEPGGKPNRLPTACHRGQKRVKEQWKKAKNNVI